MSGDGCSVASLACSSDALECDSDTCLWPNTPSDGGIDIFDSTLAILDAVDADWSAPPGRPPGLTSLAGPVYAAESGFPKDDDVATLASCGSSSDEQHQLRNFVAPDCTVAPGILEVSATSSIVAGPVCAAASGIPTHDDVVTLASCGSSSDEKHQLRNKVVPDGISGFMDGGVFDVESRASMLPRPPEKAPCGSSKFVDVRSCATLDLEGVVQMSTQYMHVDRNIFQVVLTYIDDVRNRALMRNVKSCVLLLEVQAMIDVVKNFKQSAMKDALIGMLLQCHLDFQEEGLLFCDDS